ncbi:MAG: type I-E CRISPR-associated protein Cse2/CasB [Marinobacter sp.]|uniref:type I-E CRISPR-associated protein Cse2/CasB n=1 Tax=Marinobacter sp. TaxID=50741 RepID=UPI00299E2FD7|nr:type I-E CRISPR-associated protein Cse2/CasB [Marinobacter sp.]MDX1755917.1 type I-E CRISPR-associated protein Cse2/CasB [Marinobacter sp.]
MTSNKVYYQVLRDESQQRRVLTWWARLHNQSSLLQQMFGDGAPPLPPAQRAQLRRCHTVDDVLMTEGFRNLWFAVGEDLHVTEADMLAWGMVAGALAEVRQHDASASFAAAMGEQKDKTGKPYISELRFAQLQKSDGVDTFLRRCRRSIALLGKRAHVTSLADGILHWATEHQGSASSSANQRLAVRWATDYFTALTQYQK